MPDTKELPQPQSGGRYVRELDGSLTQIHETKPTVGRVQRDAVQGDDAQQPAGDQE